MPRSQRSAKSDGKSAAKSDDKADDGKMKRSTYEKELHKLQVELCHLQEWVKTKGLQVIIVFEGRDAAGKGGTIKALTERVSPRVFRVVALPAPSDRQKTQMYFQRYIEHFPAARRNRDLRSQLVQPRRRRARDGLCRQQALRDLSGALPGDRRQYIVDGGIILIKIWLEVGMEEQERRFAARVEDPLRQWKLSPMDVESYSRWYDYSRARDAMLKATDSKHAPWTLVHTDDKRRGRLNCIAHILDSIPYKKPKRDKVKLPARSNKNAYDDQASLKTAGTLR